MIYKLSKLIFFSIPISLQMLRNVMSGGSKHQNLAIRLDTKEVRA